MSTVIHAENLGKKYTIGHQMQRRQYVALRDVMMQNARTFWHKTRDLLQGKPVIQGDTLEEIWALKDVSFEIKQGQAVGIIGRNGAGKSTLLKILSRITEPSAGRVTIKGRVSSLLEVGTGFHPELTGRENVYLNGAILGMTRQEIKRKFDEIVAFAEVEKFLDTPVKRFSSGMYVRLAFAVAAHLEPEVLLVDEVLAVGDMAFQKKCLGKMGEVAHAGRTVLFVSHNMGAISSLCKRCILLNQGGILCDDTSSSAIKMYLTNNFERGASEIALQRKPGSVVQVINISAKDADGRLVSELEMGEDAFLHIEYIIEKRASGVFFAVLVSKEETPVLYTYDTDVDEKLSASREPGKYHCYVPLPMALFKEGDYAISVLIGYGKENLTDPNARISLRVVNNRLDLTHKSYLKNRPGFLFRDIKWKTELVESL